MQTSFKFRVVDDDDVDDDDDDDDDDLLTVSVFFWYRNDRANCDTLQISGSCHLRKGSLGCLAENLSKGLNGSCIEAEKLMFCADDLTKYNFKYIYIYTNTL